MAAARYLFATPVAALVLLAAAAAQAKTLEYSAKLDGQVITSHTGSKATAAARMKVDTETQKVDLQLDVSGIGLEALRAGLVKAPVGPIHLHIYAGHDHEHADVALLLPLVYGPGYKATPGGFSVSLSGYPYAAGAAVVKSDVPFDAFLAALDRGDVILNIHTESFPDGEISGVMARTKG
jgi:hypothetical protein